MGRVWVLLTFVAFLSPAILAATIQDEFNKFSLADAHFSELFLSAAEKLNSGVSAIYSPYSLLYILAELYLYAGGRSAKQLLAGTTQSKVTKSEIRRSVPVFLEDLNSQQNVNISLAFRVYADSKDKLSKAFLKDTKNVFKAEAQNLDFDNPTRAAEIINNWVARKTRNLIQNILSPSEINSFTRLILVDAIYFQSNWLNQFDEQSTQDRIFYVNENKNKTVKMMYIEDTFNYAELPRLNAQVVQLPYENTNFSFVIILPKAKNGLRKILNAFAKSSSANSVLGVALKKVNPIPVALSLPVMHTTSSTNLAELLPKLNITSIFNPKTANLTGILEKPETVYVSSATQKASITVNEGGTLAAASNSAVINNVSGPNVQLDFTTVNADHPYAYFILYKDVPIFVGVYAG